MNTSNSHDESSFQIGCVALGSIETLSLSDLCNVLPGSLYTNWELHGYSLAIVESGGFQPSVAKVWFCSPCE